MSESSTNTTANLETFRRYILSDDPNSLSVPSTSSVQMNTPLSGSNRVRQLSRAAVSRTSKSKERLDSPQQSTSSVSSSYTNPFPIPTYLQHSNYADQFFTVKPPQGLYSDVSTSASSTSSSSTVKGKGLESDVIQLPTAWSTTDKCALIELGSDNLTVSFGGSAKYGDRDAASIRSNFPIPPQTSIYYYEIKILSSGQSGYIAFGLSSSRVNLSRLPGWEKESYAYHADDGRSFDQSGTGDIYGPGFGKGDVVGCGIDWTGGRFDEGKLSTERAIGNLIGGARVFFTKNGKFIKYVFNGLKGDLYPTVGLRTPGESVQVNFGAKPFQFDIDSLVLERKLQIAKSISFAQTSSSAFHLPSSLPPSVLLPPVALLISSSERVRITNEELILDYLKFNGFTKTSESFFIQLKEERSEKYFNIGTANLNGQEEEEEEEEEDVKMVESSLILSDEIPKDPSEVRQEIVRLILEGKCAYTSDLIIKYFPPIALNLNLPEEEITSDAGETLIFFKLALQSFIEQVINSSQSGKCSESIPSELMTPEEAQLDEDLQKKDLDALLESGRNLHKCYSTSKNPVVQKGLALAFSLMAYNNLSEIVTLCGDFLSLNARRALADEVNSKILESQSLSPQSHLEALTRHITASIKLLGDTGVGEAALVDVQDQLFLARD